MSQYFFSQSIDRTQGRLKYGDKLCDRSGSNPLSTYFLIDREPKFFLKNTCIFILKIRKGAKLFYMKIVFFTFTDLFSKLLLVFWKKNIYQFKKKKISLEIKFLFCPRTMTPLSRTLISRL